MPIQPIAIHGPSRIRSKMLAMSRLATTKPMEVIASCKPY